MEVGGLWKLIGKGIGIVNRLLIIILVQQLYFVSLRELKCDFCNLPLYPEETTHTFFFLRYFNFVWVVRNHMCGISNNELCVYDVAQTQGAQIGV